MRKLLLWENWVDDGARLYKVVLDIFNIVTSLWRLRDEEKNFVCYHTESTHDK